MSISRQIGWSNESNLLYQILKQLVRLTGIIANLVPKNKRLDVLLNQKIGNPPTLVFEFENTIAPFTMDYAGAGQYNIVFPTGTFIGSEINILGFAYSGSDDEATAVKYFIVKNAGDDKILLFQPEGYDENNLIRVSLIIK